MSSGYGDSSPFFNRGAGTPYAESSFSDPFNDYATTQMPTTMRSALWWSEYIWGHQGTYRTVMERIVSYFLTDIELGGEASEDEKKKYEEFLTKQLHVLAFAQNVLRDRLCYGNAFVSVVVPFRRYLQCPKTGSLYPLHVVYEDPAFQFTFDSNFDFIATCPKSGWRGIWGIVDKPREESDQLLLKRWSPHEMELLTDPYTDEISYFWRIPEYYKRLLREGHLFYLERASKEVLKAIKNNKLFRFHKDKIFHMKEATLAGIRNLGWGLPRSLINFRQIWHVQVLRRYNEALALDYIVPFRLITPGNSGGAGAGGIATNDPMSIYAAGDFRGQVRAMLNRRRRDPASWHMLPFPVNYQMLGSDAKQLAPTELIQQGYEGLLNESGAPVEFYNGSLTVQAAPIALRLFESTHRGLVTDTNRLLQWIVDRISQVMSWERVEAKLRRVTLADDAQKQMAALQLMMGQQLSGTSGLAAVGYDWVTEQRQLADEARKQQEMQARLQEEMEQAGFAQQIAKGVNPAAPQGQGGDPNAAGQAAAGGDPNAAAAMPTPVSSYIQSMGANANVTPNDLQAAAENLSQQLLGLPEGVKDSELRKLKQHNPTLHSVVRAKMDEIRGQLRTQGGAMLQQQQFGS